MKFVMEVELGNAAFHDDDGDFDPGPEIYTILRKAGKHARDGAESGTLYDTNGNRVGSWGVKE